MIIFLSETNNESRSFLGFSHVRVMNSNKGDEGRVQKSCPHFEIPRAFHQLPLPKNRTFVKVRNLVPSGQFLFEDECLCPQTSAEPAVVQLMTEVLVSKWWKHWCYVRELCCRKHKFQWCTQMPWSQQASSSEVQPQKSTRSLHCDWKQIWTTTAAWALKVKVFTRSRTVQHNVTLFNSFKGIWKVEKPFIVSNCCLSPTHLPRCQLRPWNELSTKWVCSSFAPSALTTDVDESKRRCRQ